MPSDRLSSLRSGPADQTAPVTPTTPRCCCAAQSVNAAYGSLQVLFGIDLEIRRGEMVALLGTNGAGKSSLLKTVTGLLPASAGTVRFAGVRHHRHLHRGDRPVRPDHDAGRSRHLPLADGGREPASGLVADPSPPGRSGGGSGSSRGHVPGARGAIRCGGGQPVGRRAADAVVGHGVPGPPPTPVH